MGDEFYLVTECLAVSVSARLSTRVPQCLGIGLTGCMGVCVGVLRGTER